MWCALAANYESLSRVHDAIKCYKRALHSSEEDTYVLSKLAKLYVDLQKFDTAAYYYKLCYSDAQYLGSADRKLEEVEQACFFLAGYYKEKGAISEAVRLCVCLGI